MLRAVLCKWKAFSKALRAGWAEDKWYQGELGPAGLADLSLAASMPSAFLSKVSAERAGAITLSRPLIFSTQRGDKVTCSCHQVDQGSDGAGNC